MRQLSEVIGPRLAGTDGEIRARDYIAGELRRYGYDVSIQDFSFDASAFLPGRVEAAGRAISGYALEGSPGGSAAGPLVFIGLGAPSDIPASGLTGAIALVERGDVTFEEKVASASAAGAAGVIIYNNEDGALLAKAPNAAVPAIGIRRADGDELRQLAVSGGATVTIAISPPRGTAFNVVAKPPGVDTCETVSGGHYDSVAVTGGADDNASGTSAVLELARVVAANDREEANCFVLFGAEEFGLFGSEAFVDSLSDAELNALRAMINLDVVGTDSDMSLIGDEDIVETARVAAADAGIEARAGSIPNGAGSDHISFQDAGVPAVFFYRNDDLIHTPQDNITRISAESLEETVRAAYGTLLAIIS